MRDKKWDLKTDVSDERLSISTHPAIAKARAKLFKRYFSIKNELVYGCSGIGADVIELHSQFDKVYCFDIDDKAVLNSRKIFKEKGITNATARVGDITKKETFLGINSFSMALVTPFRSYEEEKGRGFFKKVVDMKPFVNDVLRAIPSNTLIYELPVIFDIAEYYDLIRTLKRFSYEVSVPYIVYYLVDGAVKMKEAWIEKRKEVEEPLLMIYDTNTDVHYSYNIEFLISSSARSEIEEKFSIRL